jgi:hypothetical protein
MARADGEKGIVGLTAKMMIVPSTILALIPFPQAGQRPQK